ncbi:MAG: DUF4280 domain-containing protein [Novosphingobium sp.]
MIESCSVPAEKISIAYEKLGSVGGTDYYHQTLVYEKANGEKYFATAVASSSPKGGILSQLSGLFSSPVSAVTGSESAFGTLKTYSGPLSSLSKAEQEHWFGPSDAPYPSRTVASGDDLSGQWQKIQLSYLKTGAANLSYSPLTQNSNSTATTALNSAGVTPAKTDYWSPAADNFLSDGDSSVSPGPLNVISLKNKIACTGCPIPNALLVTSQLTVLNEGPQRATIADCIPMVNVMPFGPCAFTPAPPSPSGGPCIPKPVGMWKPGSATTFVAKIPALRQTDTLQCGMGGTIMVLFPGQTKYLVK